MGSSVLQTLVQECDCYYLHAQVSRVINVGVGTCMCVCVCVCVCLCVYKKIVI